MYKCEQCGSQSKIGEKLNRKITKSRPKTYENVFKDDRKRETKKITEGNEIVQELLVCGGCS